MTAESRESTVLALLKCLGVGAGVGLAGLAVSALTLPILLTLREPGLLAMLVLLPCAAFLTWRATGRYLDGLPNRYRVAVALAIRYFVVGAVLGLFLKFLLGGWVSDAAYFVSLGSALGTIGGSFGGAFQGWIQSRHSLPASNVPSR